MCVICILHTNSVSYSDSVNVTTGLKVKKKKNQKTWLDFRNTFKLLKMLIKKFV